MKFSVITQDPASRARRGTLNLFHGNVETPVFMPVATRGAIRAMPMRFVDEIGFEIMLANTYHLYIRPGIEVLEKIGGPA